MPWHSNLLPITEPGVEGGNLRVIAGRLIVRARHSRYARSVAVLAGGTAAGQAIGILAAPLLTRLYTPADFGIFAAFTAVLAIVVIVSSLRYDVAVPLAHDDDDAANLLVLSLLIAIAMSALVAALVFIFAADVTRIGGMEGLRPYLWIMPLSVIGAGGYQALLSWAIRREAMGAIARTKLSQGVGMVAVQLGFGAFGAGPVGLMTGWVVGQTGGSGTLATLIWRKDRAALAGASLSRMRGLAVRYRRLAMLSTGSAFLNTLVLGVPALFLASAYGLKVAGAYALGQRVVGVPMLLIGSSMAQVYTAEAFRLVRHDALALDRLFTRTAVRLLLVGTVPVLGLSLTAPWTFAFVFGAEWREAGIYLALLAPVLLVQFVASQLSVTLEVLERQDLFLVASVVRLGLLGIVVVLAPFLTTNDLIAIGLLGSMNLLGYLFYMGLGWYALMKRRTELLREQGDAP